MSDPSVPNSNGQHKPYGAGFAHYQAAIAHLAPRDIL
jgi:hypothetical protein